MFNKIFPASQRKLIKKITKKLKLSSAAIERDHIAHSINNFLALPSNFSHIKSREVALRDTLLKLQNDKDITILSNAPGISDTKLSQCLSELMRIYQLSPETVKKVFLSHITSCQKLEKDPVLSIIAAASEATAAYLVSEATYENIKNKMFAIYQLIALLNNIGFHIDIETPNLDFPDFKSNIRFYTKKLYLDIFQTLLCLGEPLDTLIKLSIQMRLPVALFNPPFSWEGDEASEYIALVDYFHHNTVSLLGFVELFEFFSNQDVSLEELLNLAGTSISTHYGFYTPMHNDPIAILSLLKEAGANENQLCNALITRNISNPIFGNALSMLFNAPDKLEYILKTFLQSYPSKQKMFATKAKGKTLKQLAHDMGYPDIVSLLETYGDDLPLPKAKAPRPQPLDAAAGSHYESGVPSSTTSSLSPKSQPKSPTFWTKRASEHSHPLTSEASKISRRSP